MFMCMRESTRVHMYVGVCVYKRECMSVFMCMKESTRVHMYVSVCVYERELEGCSPVLICVCVCVCASDGGIPVCAHMHIWTCIQYAYVPVMCVLVSECVGERERMNERERERKRERYV